MSDNEVIQEIMKLYLQSIINGKTNPFDNPTLQKINRNDLDKALANCINFQYVDGLMYTINENSNNIYSATGEIRVTDFGIRFLNH